MTKQHKLTDAMIEAGRVAYFHFRQQIEADVLFADLMEEEQEGLCRVIYLAMHQASNPTEATGDDVEQLARAICCATQPGSNPDLVILEGPFAQRPKWAEFEAAAEAAIATRSPNRVSQSVVERVRGQIKDAERAMIEERKAQYGSAFKHEQQVAIEMTHRQQLIGANLMAAALATQPATDTRIPINEEAHGEQCEDYLRACRQCLDEYAEWKARKSIDRVSNDQGEKE